MPSKGACKEGSWEKQLRNGTELREMLPLWQRDGGNRLAGSGKRGGGYLMPKVSSGHVPVGSM